MTLESQLTSLELSKRLKELGARQKSLFYWDYYQDQSRIIYPSYEYRKLNLEKFGNYISAFTVAELGEMLPQCTLSWRTPKGVNPTTWHCEDRGRFEFTAQANTEADARAKFLIYLLENNLIKL